MSVTERGAQDTMHTIILGTGLSNGVLSPEHQYQGSKSNVGQREIARLMGRGRTFGEGPLPTLLKKAVELQARGGSISVVLLTDELGEDSAELVEPIQELAGEAHLIAAPSSEIPWQLLLERAGELAGLDPMSETARSGGLQFLVVGCHTDRHVQALATLLRNAFGITGVAVSPHLVGSATQEAHFAALRHNLPSASVDVLLDLEEVAAHVGLQPEDFAHYDCRPCVIEPEEAREAFDPAQRRILELICMHWTRVHLKPLAGGYSGSLLFMAEGWKGEARTEPLVLKVDAFGQMRRELDGYHQVKDFFGKHVPTFGYPVSSGEALGVGMELAAMEGRPETLQDSFEEAEGEESLARFMTRLEKALSLLSVKLYKNTSELSWVAPYRSFGLHAEKQLIWLRQNADIILEYFAEENGGNAYVDPEQLTRFVRLITANQDGLDSEVCLSHGDLNFANIICDDVDNIWFIDWTHSGPAPLELDFAKLENDVKFVMTKTFDMDDLPRLRKFEEYLLAQRLPADVDGLPDALKFAKWDFRFRKILGAVRKIRQTCFSIKQSDDWLAYQIALLRYALHTLSFDKRRGRGECELPQLMYALYSVESLAYILVADDFHLKIRAERPRSYPPRQRILLDEAPWPLDCPEYVPPYHVDSSVLEQDRFKTAGGWADPEDISSIADDLAARPAKYSDDVGRPLNPRGRTGIAGRGLLGLWGCNLSVAASVVRSNATTGEPEILLGGKEEQTDLELPKGFVLPGESPDSGIGRVVESETGWRPEEDSEVVFEGYTYDPRQTDHAWVETRVYLYLVDADAAPDSFDPSELFDEVRWWPLEAGTVNRVPAGQARFIRESIVKLMESDRMEKSRAEDLLARTG
jgi:ADP-ribose pyrophosphatase